MRMGTTTLFIICSAIWGSTWLAIKYQLGVVAPELSVAYRFGLAAIVLFAWCIFTRRSLRFSGRAHGYLAALGVMLFGLNYIGIYWAERFVTSGLVAVLFSTIVFYESRRHAARIRHTVVDTHIDCGDDRRRRCHA